MGLLNTLILTLVKKILAFPTFFIVTHRDKERYDARRCLFKKRTMIALKIG